MKGEDMVDIDAALNKLVSIHEIEFDKDAAYRSLGIMAAITALHTFSTQGIKRADRSAVKSSIEGVCRKYFRPSVVDMISVEVEGDDVKIVIGSKEGRK
ncbi:MAG: hypothetical protein HDQ88_02235 [Clostridia bacterium]|nr:hypothetical protein [Clostridia bacterium]